MEAFQTIHIKADTPYACGVQYGQQAKEKIVNVLSSMPEIGFSAKSLKCIAGCSDRTVNNVFSELLADGVIKAIGTTKDRTYFYNIKKPPKKPKEKKYHKEADDLI